MFCFVLVSHGVTKVWLLTPKSEIDNLKTRLTVGVSIL